MTVTILTAAIVLGNVCVLWWLFRDESNQARLAVVALVGAALCLRLIYPTDYPPGYNPDEPQYCRAAAWARAMDNPIVPSANGSSALDAALFCVPLLPYVSPRLAIRGYSIVLSSFSVAAVYALCRAMQLGISASLTAAALLAVLPWSLFYGRVSQSGELVYYDLIAGGALARFVWRPQAGWREALAGAGAIALLLYNYTSTMVMLLLPLVLLVLIPTWRRRAWCVGMTMIAAVAWIPWWRVSPYQWVLWHMLTGTADPMAPSSWLLPHGVSDIAAVLVHRIILFAQCLAQPVAELYIMSQPAVLVHPLVVLIAAALGVLCTTWRRKFFLLASCGIGALAALLSNQASISGHRALLGVPFVTVAAACGIQCVPWHRIRLGAAVVLVAFATMQSLELFFSRGFWPPILTDAFPWPP